MQVLLIRANGGPAQLKTVTMRQSEETESSASDCPRYENTASRIQCVIRKRILQSLPRNRFRALVRGKLIKPVRIDQLEPSTLSADVSTFWFRPGSRERNNEGR